MKKLIIALALLVTAGAYAANNVTINGVAQSNATVAITTPGSAPPPPPPPPPPTPPPPSSTPAGCAVQDVTWGVGLSYNTNGAPVIAMTGNMAFRVPLTYFGNKTSGSYRHGNVQFYETTAAVRYSISASPCGFAASTTSKSCQGVSSAGQSSDHYYVTNDSPDPPSTSYCQLPALPSGQTHYFVNIRPTGTLGSFFLLFD